MFSNPHILKLSLFIDYMELAGQKAYILKFKLKKIKI